MERTYAERDDSSIVAEQNSGAHIRERTAKGTTARPDREMYTVIATRLSKDIQVRRGTKSRVEGYESDQCSNLHDRRMLHVCIEVNQAYIGRGLASSSIYGTV